MDFGGKNTDSDSGLKALDDKCALCVVITRVI